MRPIGLVSLVLFLATSGCLQPEQVGSSHDGGQGTEHPPDTAFALLAPFIINGTESSTITLTFKEYAGPDGPECDQHQVRFARYVLYDTQRKIASETVMLDFRDGPQQSFEIEIPTTARFPLVLLGDHDLCIDPGSTRATGITAGHLHFRPTGWKGAVKHTESIPVRVQAGTMDASTMWNLSEDDWSLDQSGLPGTHDGGPNPSGEYRGRISMYDPAGRLVWSRHLTTLGSTAAFGEMVAMDGRYRIEVQMDVLPIKETTWVVQARTFHVGNDFCDLGFEWSCGNPDPGHLPK